MAKMESVSPYKQLLFICVPYLLFFTDVDKLLVYISPTSHRCQAFKHKPFIPLFVSDVHVL